MNTTETTTEKSLLGNANSKLKETGKKHGVRIYNFSIPAYKSITGKVTCPFADACVKFCYAQKGAYAWTPTRAALERRYEATKQANFADRITAELNRKSRTKPIYVRIHDSGDFYSDRYFLQWCEIADRNEDVTFYAYTKSHSIARRNAEAIPSNLELIFSEGSKEDHKLDRENERHARIFATAEELREAGYIDASKDDLEAISGPTMVGLVMH